MSVGQKGNNKEVMFYTWLNFSISFMSSDQTGMVDTLLVLCCLFFIVTAWSQLFIEISQKENLQNRMKLLHVQMWLWHRRRWFLIEWISIYKTAEEIYFLSEIRTKKEIRYAIRRKKYKMQVITNHAEGLSKFTNQGKKETSLNSNEIFEDRKYKYFYTVSHASIHIQKN